MIFLLYIRHLVEENHFTYLQLNPCKNQFRYEVNDGKDQPADLSPSSDKRSGHAVQNSFFLRLLPLMVGDRIKDPCKVRFGKSFCSWGRLLSSSVHQSFQRVSNYIGRHLLPCMIYYLWPVNDIYPLMLNPCYCVLLCYSHVPLLWTLILQNPPAPPAWSFNLMLIGSSIDISNSVFWFDSRNLYDHNK